MKLRLAAPAIGRMIMPKCEYLLNLELRGGRFDGAPERMQAAHTRVAGPAEDELAHAACRDELVVYQVGGQAAGRQVAPPLTDDFMSGGKGNQMGEPFERNRVAVEDELANGVGHRHHLVTGQLVGAHRRVVSAAGTARTHRKPTNIARSSRVWV